MLIEHLTRQLREREAQSLPRRRRLLASPCGPRVQLRDEHGGERALLAFCSNDYLGLANHPQVGTALAQGALRWGAGSGASALVSGHLQPQAALEDRLATWFAPHIPGARVLAFGTGYLANLALMTALGDGHASLHADKLNHASLVDGALLARAPLQRYAHGRLDVLATQLERSTAPVKLIVTDAVFSMDGDLADLPALLALAERHDAWLVVDDAHGFGVLGAQGRGTLQHFGLCSERFILMGTLGKAAGVAGAFVAAHPVVIEWLLQAARTAIYTTAPPPALAQALLASLDLIEGEEGARRRARLSRLITLLRERVGQLLAARPRRGWTLADSPTAIQPLIVGDNTTALRLSAWLEAQGLWVPAIRPPTVPAGSARLRISLSAAHTDHELLRLVDTLAHAMEVLE
jgi:8-amino-7-oxononanoate synthase